MTTLAEGVAACDALLRECYGIDVAKVLDPANPRSLLILQNRISQALSSAAKGNEADALRVAIAALDVDWPALTPTQVDNVVDAARAAYAAGVPAARLGGRIGGVLFSGGKTVAAAAKTGTVARFSLEAATQLNRVDERILRAVAFNSAATVKDEFGRRGAQLSIRARAVVADGLSQGLGREALMRALRDQLGSLAGVLSDNYWRTVGNYMAVTARSYGDLGTYAEAGVTKFSLEAALDKKTTPACRFMHGKEFSVQAAISNIEQATPTAPLPWLRDSKGEIWYRDAGGGRRVVADVRDSGAGKVGSTGVFTNQTPETALQNAGIDTPPFHGNCRTTILAVL